MRDVPTMLRTTQAARRWRHYALCLAAGLIVGLFWSVFLWVMWRAV